jgi:hypothetical protein
MALGPRTPPGAAVLLIGVVVQAAVLSHQPKPAGVAARAALAIVPVGSLAPTAGPRDASEAAFLEGMLAYRSERYREAATAFAAAAAASEQASLIEEARFWYALAGC